MKLEKLEEIPYLKAMLGVPRERLKVEYVKDSENPGPPKLELEQLDGHLRMLSQEFSERRRLEFLHAILIVLIRRRIGLKRARKLFFDIWERETEFLCDHLTLRWLVSACDTVCDHPRSKMEATVAVSTSTFINTLKLYETERFTLQDRTVSRERLEALRGKRLELFDGLTAYGIGRGDMILNLKRRIESTRQGDATFIARIFFAAADRAFQGDTVFSRMRAVHTNDATRW
jgi:hypothetical protein